MGYAAATSICVNVSMSAETVDHRQPSGGDCASGSDYQSRLPFSISNRGNRLFGVSSGFQFQRAVTLQVHGAYPRYNSQSPSQSINHSLAIDTSQHGSRNSMVLPSTDLRKRLSPMVYPHTRMVLTVVAFAHTSKD